MAIILWTDNQRLRVDMGLLPDDTATLSDVQADDAYARARALYADPNVANVATRVLTAEQLYARAVTSTDYTQNSTVERASQLFDHYGKLLDRWTRALSDAQTQAALQDAAGSVHSGMQVRKPARYKEFPGGWWGDSDISRF